MPKHQTFSRPFYKEELIDFNANVRFIDTVYPDV